MSQPLDYASPQADPAGRKSANGNGFLAIAGTLIFSGVGHALAGEVRRGLWWFGVMLAVAVGLLCCTLVPVLIPGLIVLAPISVTIQLSCLVDAFLCGRRAASPMLSRPIWRYLAGAAILVVLLVLQPVGRLVKFAIYPLNEAYIMPTASMSPTINPKDRFFGLKTAWTIRRWDVVVFHPPIQAEEAEVYVKRIVGLPGEKIEIINGVVHVNDQPVHPPVPIGSYQMSNAMWRKGNGTEGNPIHLGSDEYFVLGDNSPISGDSRLWEASSSHQAGALPADHIIGRATAIYWPISRWGYVK